MVKYQKEFTETEAMAICGMIAMLANEDYKLAVYNDAAEDDPEGEGKHYPFIVQVVDTDNNVVSAGRAYFLIDALTMAYLATPERTR